MKLYYSDGKEVMSGDLVEDETGEYFDIGYSVFNDKYELRHSMGVIGEIDNVDDFKLVKRYSEEIMHDLLCGLNELKSHISQERLSEVNDMIYKINNWQNEIE